MPVVIVTVRSFIQIANSDLSKAKFSEEDVAIIDYEHIFRNEEDQGDLDE